MKVNCLWILQVLSHYRFVVAKNNIMKQDKRRLIDLSVDEFFTAMEERNQHHAKKYNDQTIILAGDRNIKVKECAKITGYKEGYVRQLVFKKAIPYFKQNNRSLRFSYNEIVAWTQLRKHMPIEEAAQRYIENPPFGKKGRFFNA